MASKNSPGKAHREGISLVQLCDMFPTEESAQKWFEKIVWPNGRTCPRCGKPTLLTRCGKSSRGWSASGFCTGN